MKVRLELFISEKTVKSYVSNILMKLDPADRRKVAVYARRSEIVPQILFVRLA
jgi:DNA-binding NarL/FixJ family response regulator